MSRPVATLLCVAAMVCATATQSAPGGELYHRNAELEGRLRDILGRTGGTAGVAVAHVESGRRIAVNGSKRLHLFSVFKLPLAVTVLKDVQAGRLRLEQAVRVTREDVAPGWQGNTDRWREPVELSIRALLELSLVHSDNTASDRLLRLVGGPASVSRQMRSLGFHDIQVRTSVREFATRLRNPNIGSAKALVGLLSSLQEGQVLDPDHLRVLLDLMTQTTTGERRIKGNLPTGTPVAAKTGTGRIGTNDVGLITLPNGDHVAIAVLINESKLPTADQEKVIAELARAAYDSLTLSLASP